MNLKQFLKPDWRKIVITIVSIFYVLLVIVSFITGGMFVDCTEEGFRLHPESCGYKKPLIEINDLRVTFIISIVISYILSCLIVWIYDKFRKKK